MTWMTKKKIIITRCFKSIGYKKQQHGNSNEHGKRVTEHEKQLADLLVAISWADLSRTYFGKSSSWLYHKMDGRDGNGKPTSFTAEEIEELKGALLDLSNRIRRAAESI